MNKLYYNVHNGGDGSVNVYFFESKELSEFDEEFETDKYDEAFAESSCGELEFENDIKPTEIGVSGVHTKESYFLEEFVDGYNISDEQCQKFLDKFFDGFFPKCTSKKEPTRTEEYVYHYIYLPDGTCIGKLFEKSEIPAEEILEKINRWAKNEEKD